MTDKGLDKASMGKASRTKVESTRREKIAAQRAAQRRSEQRRRILIASGSVVVVLAVVLAFVVIKLNSAGKRVGSASASPQGLSNGPTGSALAPVVAKVTSVPASTLNAVGDGSGAVTSKPTTISGTTLTENGKPEMLFFGAEYCPYCAAERWAMIVALSRFGTFKGLATVHSAVKNGAGDAEPDPDTPSWTFVHATYSSPYLTFSPVETADQHPGPDHRDVHHPADAHRGPAGPVHQVRGPGRVDPVDRLRQPLHDFRGQLQPGRARRAQLEHDRDRPEQPEQPGGPGGRRYGELHHGRDLQGLTGNQPASACTPVVQSLESQI